MNLIHKNCTNGMWRPNAPYRRFVIVFFSSSPDRVNSCDEVEGNISCVVAATNIKEIR